MIDGYQIKQTIQTRTRTRDGSTYCQEKACDALYRYYCRDTVFVLIARLWIVRLYVAVVVGPRGRKPSCLWLSIHRIIERTHNTPFVCKLMT